MKTVKDFAEAFKISIIEASVGFDEVRVVFDRYLTKSFKNQTRRKRTGKKNFQYKVDDNTSLEKVQLKDFLSHVETKRELTIYLSNYISVVFEAAKMQYCVVYETFCKTNIRNFNQELLEHDQEEADTLLILHSIDACARDAFVQIYVVSPDTDVFLLLIYFCKKLSGNTFFRTGKKDKIRDIDISKAYNALGQARAKALIGFHAFTGCDVTAKFCGKGKASCWNLFLEADNEILDSFATIG